MAEADADSDTDSARPARNRWPALFHDASQPLFVLYRTRRIRYVNPAFEKLVHRSREDLLGRACTLRGPTENLFRTLAPPSGTLTAITTVRRVAPTLRQGPPWWDVTFIPLDAADGSRGFLGRVDVVQPTSEQPPRSLPVDLAARRQTHGQQFTRRQFPAGTPRADRLQQQLDLAATTRVPLWIHGEPGTGKQTLARIIHHTASPPHCDRACIAIPCSGLVPYLTDALLFGLGGVASTPRAGTLILHHPEKLPLELQSRIVHWLTGPAAFPPPRLIVLTQQSPTTSLGNPALLPAFVTVFSTLDIRLPPLREQMDQLPWYTTEVLSDEVRHLLQRPGYRWPGNLRELRQVLEQARATAGPDLPLAVPHFPRVFRERLLLAENPLPAPPPQRNLDQILEQVERRLIQLAMQAANGNQTDAAAQLGIFRTRLARRLEALGLS
ncbi:MAG: helix-turn-helix domain-containing protein [Gemmataceae bacterium]